MDILSPGTRIGQYEIVSRPMMGGMGVVYFALDHGDDGRPVALKTFRPELLPDRAARDRFLREGTAWVELGNHPHIVRCYSVQYYAPTIFLVLELIAKEPNMPDASLRSWLIPGHPMPLEQALLFALQIARGMQHATERIPGFVHRDLKPENILVGADKLPGTKINHLRVTDFGLAKTLRHTKPSPDLHVAKQPIANQLQFTLGIGTPLYMAPEQWEGKSVGTFTDIYAFGCILYEIITGYRAAEGKTIPELQASHCSGKLRSIPANLPKDVTKLLTNCLATRSDQRYKNWNEATEIIEHAYLKQSGVLAPQIAATTESPLNARQQMSWSYQAIGSSYTDIGKANLSLSYFEQALIIAGENNDQAAKAQVLNSIGGAYVALGDMRRGIEYFEQSLGLAREANNQRIQSSIFGGMGLAYAYLGNYPRAIEHCKQAIEIARRVGDPHLEENTLGNLGLAYTRMNLFEQAIRTHEQAVAIAREIGSRIEEGVVLNSLGEAYRGSGNLQQAISYCQRAKEIAQEVGNRQGECQAMGNIGAAYSTLGDDFQAINYFTHALEIAREIGDRYHEGLLLGNLGSQYAILGDKQQAIAYLNQALLLRRAGGASDLVAATAYNIGLLYQEQGAFSQALPLVEEAAQMWLRFDNPRFKLAQQLVGQLRIQVAFLVFPKAKSLDEMKAIVNQYPFTADDDFLQAAERIIEQHIPLEGQSALKQCLGWMRQIANQK
ncbi:MAG TPA: serine/threonine-protein kinase [Anaerolineales bacterium]|nr:serine/threonine-protein kinase [Anaerolineales bacterium]HLO30837.1 serine/threonine-protein kinase [Anaerolineales bacterium]